MSALPFFFENLMEKQPGIFCLEEEDERVVSLMAVFLLLGSGYLDPPGPGSVQIAQFIIITF